MAAFSQRNDNDEYVLLLVSWTYEACFLLALCIEFFVDYKEDGMNSPERDISKTSYRYLSNEFCFDAIPCLPLQFVSLGGNERLFYLIKIIRLFNGFKLFNVPDIMENIKYYNRKKLEKIIRDDPILAEDKINDNNNITKMIMTNFLI